MITMFIIIITIMNIIYHHQHHDDHDLPSHASEVMRNSLPDQVAHLIKISLFLAFQINLISIIII